MKNGMNNTIKDCWCFYCGHPVMAEGLALDPDDDFDRAGHDRDRCADTACQSSAVATYQGGVIVVADDCGDRLPRTFSRAKDECWLTDRRHPKRADVPGKPRGPALAALEEPA